jgi:ribosomal protein S18 acetylase RimI-like enzyme
MDASYPNAQGADTPNSAATIRRAEPGDAEALAAIGQATFVETFGHLYPPEDLAAFLAEAHGLERARANLADPAKAVWLVEKDGEVIGYALACPAKLPHQAVMPEDGELDRIYIRNGYQGGGLGGRLLVTALEWLEKDGPRTLWIGVWSENLGAQGLYDRHGFKVVGAYKFAVGNTMDHEYIMRRG